MTALDLEAIRAEFLNLYGSCDAGIPSVCNCSGRDFRPTMLELVREVERLRVVAEAISRELTKSAEKACTVDGCAVGVSLAGRPECTNCYGGKVGGIEFDDTPQTVCPSCNGNHTAVKPGPIVHCDRWEASDD